MRFMQKFWALFALVFTLGLGAPALASAQTPADTLACMQASLEESPFTGSYVSRLNQARRLAADTVTVSVNGEEATLTQEKPSIWALCEGPTLAEQLAVANDTIAAQKTKIDRLEGLAFKSVSARDENGNVTRGVTWKTVAEKNAKELQAAITSARQAQKNDNTYRAQMIIWVLFSWVMVAVLLFFRKEVGNLWTWFFGSKSKGAKLAPMDLDDAHDDLAEGADHHHPDPDYSGPSDERTYTPSEPSFGTGQQP